jgi:hypothetical protein
MASRIHALAEEIFRIDAGFAAPGAAQQHYVAVRRGPSGEIVLDANAAGMIHLAGQLLKLASAARPGQHYHVDEAGSADSSDPPIAITFKLAPWESS